MKPSSSSFVEKPSGLQVSFFRAVETIAAQLPHDDDQALGAAVELLRPSLPERQRAQLDERLDGYLHRRARGEEALANRQARELAAHDRGGNPTDRCGSCNRFKSRPLSVCFFCGDDPVPNAGGDPTEADRRAYDRSVWGQ